jgi:sirohydrochlorin ferrochelatase
MRRREAGRRKTVRHTIQGDAATSLDAGFLGSLLRTLHSMIDTEPRTALLLIAHGSRQEEANDDLHRLVSRFEERGEYAIVEPSFLELAEPDITKAGDRCVARGASRVLMVPYFLSAGVHLQRDLTAARDTLVRKYPEVAFCLGPALGPHPLLERLVLERIQQLDSDNPPRMFASGSEDEAPQPHPKRESPSDLARG